MGPEQALEASFEVLLVDDVCSFLTPRLVVAVRGRGSEVVGVFSPVDGSDAKRRLLECGISDVIETDASPEEFLEKIRLTLAHRTTPPEPEGGEERGGWSIAVTGTSAGVGATEVAVGLARGISTRLDVVLVDLDTTWPSIAQRLGLPPHPNLRTAIDRTLHGSGDPTAAAHLMGRMAVVGGLADLGAAAPPASAEVGMLLDDLGRGVDVVVVDLGPWRAAQRGSLGHFASLAVVGRGDPVGVGRLLRTLETATEVMGSGDVVAVVNQSSRRPFHQAEIRAELEEAFPGVGVVVLPYDRRLVDAAWEGTTVVRGPFAKAMGRVADLVAESVSR
jgi:MinD-like ATPase involved in chromosome partitioning or flagellar assembly